MSEPKFTPGPWRLTRNNEWIVGRDDKIGEVLIASRGLQSTPNAHLIAAAPEMYDVLAKLDCDDYWHAGEIPLDLHILIRQTLKKARGEV